MDDFHLEALNHPTLDTWWSSRITLAPDHQVMARAGMAILFSDGWEDYFLWPEQRAYRDFAPLAGSRARIIIIGPWEHASNNGALPYAYQQFAVLWCDRFLQGIRNGVHKFPRVLVYVQGPNQWRFEKGLATTRREWRKGLLQRAQKRYQLERERRNAGAYSAGRE
jgi:uncharacterized protein